LLQSENWGRTGENVSRLLLALSLLPCLLMAACPTPEPAYEPKLSVLQTEIFFPSCGSASCHGGSNPQSGLDMSTAQSSFDTMIEVEGVEAAGTRVVPGDPEASLLYQLMFDDVDDARQMPIGYQLPAAELESIRIWIDEGAQNN